MNKLKVKYKIIIIFIVVVIIMAAVFIPLPSRLCITESEKGRIAQVFSGNTESFIISYTHSVNRGRVKDYYTITTGGGICLTHTEFVSYGAGMPEPSENQVFSVTDDVLKISNINLFLDELVLQTGVIADHHIETEDKYVILNDVIPCQTRILIGVRKISLYEILKSCLFD